MKKLNLPTVSMEAINYQGRSLLLFDLVSSIELLRTNPAIDQAALDRSGLAGAIFKRTGIRVELLLTDHTEPYENFAEPPVVNASNPYFRLLQGYALADEHVPVLDRHQRALRLAVETMGWVDLKTGRVNGVFSTLINRVYIAKSLLDDRSYTSEEVAAVYLHEVGHLFSYFETVAYTSASNSVIETAIQAIQATDEKVLKYKLISQSLSVFGITDKDAIEAVVEEVDGTVIRALLIKTMEQAEQGRVKQLSQEKDAHLNFRSIEHMADQFAIRNGASLPLATAQHKLAKRVGIHSYGRSKAAFLAVQAVRYGALIGLTFASPPIGICMAFMVGLLLTADAVESDYRQEPGERIARIKSDVVQLLKNTRLDNKLRKQLLEDVEAIDAVRQDAKEHDGVIRFLWRSLSPSSRRQATLREFQKGLEDLINNDLFIHANRLKGG